MKDIHKKHVARVRALGYSEEQAHDLIHKLSNIMTAFIDAAWGVHPAQLAKNEAIRGDSRCDNIGTNTKQKIEGPAENRSDG